MDGMSGFDWVTYKDNTFGVTVDLTRGSCSTSRRIRRNATLDAYEFGGRPVGYDVQRHPGGSRHAGRTNASRRPLGGTDGFAGSAAQRRQSIALDRRLAGGPRRWRHLLRRAATSSSAATAATSSRAAAATTSSTATSG